MGKEDPSEIADDKSETQTFLIPQYKVLLHNDDITPMDFVTTALIRYFVKSSAEAREIMLEAHANGAALVAIMPLERAEFKVQMAHEFARSHDYPLTFSIEPA